VRRKTQQKSGRGFWRAVALGVVAGAQLVCCGQAATVAVTPVADAFVRSVAPGSNYGAAGSLSVSGSAAVNGLGQQNGLFDSLMRFPMSDVAASLNGQLGSNGWVVTAATLVVNEVGAPNNAIFNRGVGGFEIRWIGADAWAEGTGTPNTPTTDGVAYQDLASVLNPAADASLGRFTNSGVSGPVSFPLMLAGALVSNIVAGTDLNLYLTAASASVGFTFNSRNFATSNAWPSLTITAVAKPLVRITSIERLGTNQAAIRFNTVSNWTYAVQGLDGLPAGWAGAWSNLFTVPARPFDDQGVFVDTVTNRQRFYRLLLWQ
jgi:hypothetical protein